MGFTITTSKCPACGAVYRYERRGIVTEDPIGIPLVRCIRCRNVARDKRHKEWIQMNAWQKTFSIIKYDPIIEIGVAMLLHGAFLDFLSEVYFLSVYIIIPVFILELALSLYVCISFRANLNSFYERFLDSIKRTKNDEYRIILSSMGPIYDESIPKYLFILPSIKKKFQYSVENASPVEITIPYL